jgi:hypothetical protein
MLKIEGNISHLRARSAHFVGHLPDSSRFPAFLYIQRAMGSLIGEYLSCLRGSRQYRLGSDLVSLTKKA